MHVFTNYPILKKISFIILLLVFSFSFSQNEFNIHFQDEIIEIPENIESFQWNQMPESSKLDNGYIGWVQFYETPTQDIQNSFKNNHLQLLEYIPNKAYLFYFPNSASVAFLKDIWRKIYCTSRRMV